MSLFDFYIMVDWSGAARRRGMRTDAIWIAYGDIKADNPKTVSPFSRTEATQLVRSLLDDQANKGLRVLVCFDFAYGYPRDFPAALQTATVKANSTLPWLTVWQYLSDAIKDDEGTVPDRKPCVRRRVGQDPRAVCRQGHQHRCFMDMMHESVLDELNGAEIKLQRI